MKKIIISVIVIIAFVGFVIYEKLNIKSPTVSIVTTPETNPTSAPSESINPGAGSPTLTPTSSDPTPTPTPTPSPVALGKFKDGSYTGSLADAIYGPIQVQAIISGGKLTDVKFLQYPNDPGHTSEVSSFALPALKSEAIQAQSANVDNITGATQTTDGFRVTMASALSQAAK